MKILVWSFPWASQGNPLFYRNCFINHLLIQANTLAKFGHEVDIINPEIFEVGAENFFEKVNVINLEQKDFLASTHGCLDKSAEFYKKGIDADFVGIVDLLRMLLAEKYDAILLWETPVPFLEKMYPDALIVHQMPGAFSRAPYPNTVVFDPIGLYKNGSLYNLSENILESNFYPWHKNIFSNKFFKEFREISPFSRSSIDPSSKYQRLRLLPLQVSAHYAFEADTGYKSQLEFLASVLDKTPKEIGVVVTQYVHGHSKDRVLNINNIQEFQRKWPNLIYNPGFDYFPSVSQYLLPFVDDVVSCSSSVGLQALLWKRDFYVEKSTFLSPYSTKNTKDKNLVGDEATDHALGFIFGYHQVLTDKVTKDGQFLNDLLSELCLRKQKGMSGIDRLVSFDSVDVNYQKSFEKSMALPKAKRIISREVPEITARSLDAGKFSRAINNKNIEVISFDVFDTLIYRPVETPADLYSFLELSLEEELQGLADGFAKVRLSAEVTVRRSSEKAEIDLDMIYEYIGNYYSFDKNKLARLKEMEISLESKIVRARPFGQWIFNIAKESNKKIILISDMYLPEDVVAKMLENCGYPRNSYSKLFVSSRYGARKKEGKLFDLVIENLNIKPDTILHVGDNVAADIEQPKKRGIKPFRLVRALDRMRRNRLYYDIFHPREGAGEMARSVIAGTLAAKLFEPCPVDGVETTLFCGDNYKLGYAALGPVLLGYSLWLNRKAKEDGISDLYFLSREGWLFKQAYDLFFPAESNGIKSHYLMASRRASRVAAICDREALANVAMQPYSPGISLGKLLHGRFGLELSPNVLAAAQNVGYPDLETALPADADCRSRFLRLCFSIEDLIHTAVSRERSDYLSYLEDMGLLNAKNPAVVDIGWKANMQASLGNLISRPLSGYYLATLSGAQVWVTRGHRINSYIGDFLSQSFKHGILRNRHVCEFLFCASSKSLISVKKTEDGYKFNFKEEDDYEYRAKFIDKLHLGALDFCRDVEGHFGEYLDKLFIDQHTATKVLCAFLDEPVKEDAVILSKFAFEDSFGGVLAKGVVSNDRVESVWKAGFDVLKPNLEEKRQVNRKEQKVNDLPVKSSVTMAKTVADIFPKSKSNTALSSFERFIIKKTCSPRLFNKYEKDRHGFFLDSRNYFLRKWYRWLG